MLTRIEHKLGGVLARWVSGVCARAGLVTLLALFGAGAAGLYSANHLRVNADLNDMLAKDLPFRALRHQYYEAFPHLKDPLVVVIDGSTPDRAEAAADQIAADLRASDRFRSVYVPWRGAFFEENGLLYMQTSELEDLAENISLVQPYLARLSRDGSLRGFVSLLAEGAADARRRQDGVELAPAFERIREAIDAELEGRHFELSWADLILGRTSTVAEKRRYVVVYPEMDFADIQPAREAIETIQAVANRRGLAPDTGVRLRITGDLALSYDETQLVRRQAALAGFASFLLVGAILFFALRSTRLVFATLLTLIVGLVLTAGFAALGVGHLNPVSVAFAVLFIGLGVDFGIHLCLRYRELTGLGQPLEQALGDTARGVGSSLVICAFTTAVAFFAFVPTDYAGVAELGLISGAGMLISLFCSLTLLPALIALTWRDEPAIPAERGSGSSLMDFPARFPRSIVSGAAILAIAAGSFIPQVRFENNPLRIRDPQADSVTAFNDLLADGRASPWSVNVLVPDLETAQTVSERLENLDAVGRTVSLRDLVPKDQAEKLGILEDIALFMPPLSDSPLPAPSYAEQRSALDEFDAVLESIVAEEPESELRRNARALRERMAVWFAALDKSDTPSEDLIRLEESLLGSLPERLRILYAAIEAGPVTLSDLPSEWVEQMVGRDGRLRIEVFPSEDLGRGAALERFIATVHEVAPDAIGTSVVILESGRAIVRSMRQALISAAIAIGVFLLILWRRAEDAALVMVPLALATLFTGAASVLLDIPLNFADVIVIPLILGIGVDSGIHLVQRERGTHGREEDLLASSTARAVWFSALTTMASFGTLGFSSHPGIASLGQLLTVGISCTLACNLIVLPALVQLRRAA